MEKAAKLYKEKKWKELRTYLNDYLAKVGKIESPSTTYAKKMLATHEYLEKHATATLGYVRESIDAGRMTTA